MPSALTYPGVYIEEIPSGVRTIVGVATSITAFLGRAPRGPTNEPTTVTSYGDFESRFGSLDYNYPLGYAVRDFFLNGGSQAMMDVFQEIGRRPPKSSRTFAYPSRLWGYPQPASPDRLMPPDGVNYLG